MNFQIPPKDEKWVDAYIQARNLSWWALWRAGYRPSVSWQRRRMEWVPGKALLRSWDEIEDAPN